MDEERPPIEYATPKPKTNRGRDLLVLFLVGAAFAIAYSAFLFWWVLFRK